MYRRWDEERPEIEVSRSELRVSNYLRISSVMATPFNLATPCLRVIA
jgi:hypothetical protein